MLDIGWSELLVMAVAAVIVVGPKDLPRLMRTVGRYTGKARALAREFRASFDELGRETELQELNQEMEKIRREDPLTRKANAIAPPPAGENKAAGRPQAAPPPPPPRTEAAPSDKTT